MRAIPLGSIVVAALMAAWSAVAQTPPVDMPGLLRKVAERVEAYYASAQSVVCLETVRLQSLAFDFTPEGLARQLVYELRVAWNPSTDPGTPPDANVLRQLKTVNGREPKPGDEPECLDPKPVSLDPLVFLVAQHQREYTFTFKRTARADGRPAVVIDYAPATAQPPEITWHDTCVSLTLPSRTTGRVWIDQASGDVLRLEERVMGPFDIPIPRETRRVAGATSITFDRADSTIRYRAVTFHDPDETVMLPESIDSTSVFRGAGVPRLRTIQKFSGYQRFVTDVRIVQ